MHSRMFSPRKSVFSSTSFLICWSYLFSSRHCLHFQTRVKLLRITPYFLIFISSQFYVLTECLFSHYTVSSKMSKTKFILFSDCYIPKTSDITWHNFWCFYLSSFWMKEYMRRWEVHQFSIKYLLINDSSKRKLEALQTKPLKLEEVKRLAPCNY